MNLKDKRVLVTGGAVRIGRAICEELASNGCVVVVHYNKSKSEANQLIEILQSKGTECYAVGGDLCGEESCRQLIQKSSELAGGLDILINNASVFHKDTLIDVTESNFRNEIEINAFVPIFLSQAFVKLSRDVGKSLPHGKIINLLDQRVAGYETGALPYILSKKMLSDFTKIAALELAPEFTVNAVAPGPVLPPPGKGEEYVRDLAGSMPLFNFNVGDVDSGKSKMYNEGLTPRDVALAVVYLLEAEAITGQTIFVDGGQGLA